MSALTSPDMSPFAKIFAKFLLRDDALLDEQLCQRVGLGQTGHEKFL